MKSHRLAAMALICGLVVVAIAQRLAPIGGPPLYDGVPAIGPYEWLSPPPGLVGGAQSAQETDAVQDVQAGLAIGTPELPPQVQILTDPGSLAIPDSTTSITVSIDPVAAPAAQPPDGTVAGNVYQISVTDQSGAAIGMDAGESATLVLRGPPELRSATIDSFSGGTWTKLQTDAAGVPNMFTASFPGFGDFALVAPSGWVPAGEKAARATPTSAARTAAPTSTSSAASFTPGALAASAEPATSAAAATPVSSEGPATPAASEGPTSVDTSAGGSSEGSSSLPPIAVIVIALLVIVAAAMVLLRPIKPPRDGDAE
jgi:hypothetical protein